MGMLDSMLRRALLATLVATAAQAWGPYSHVILNQLAVPRLTATRGLEFLKERKYAVLFARAGASADLTFSLSGGGKVDPAMNAVLHDPGFHAELYHRCKEAEDLSCQAFALGLRGHAAGDQVGNVPTSSSAANVFGWPTDSDVFGDPVDDEDASAAAQLRTVTVGVNKILLDGLLKEHEVSWRKYHPFVDRDHLVAALQAYEGPGSLPNDTPEQREAIADDVREYDRRFGVSYAALRVLARRVHANRRLGDPLEEVFGGEAASLPAVRASVDEIVAAVERLVVGAPGPAVSMTGARAGTAGPRCHEGGGAMEGLMQVVQQQPLSASGFGGAAAAADEVGADEPVAEIGPAPLLPDKSAGGGGPAASKALAALRKRVMTEAGKHLLVPRRSWGKLRAEVLELVPIERPAEATDPGFDGLSGPR